MSNNQTKDLNKIPAVKELSNETAANVQGGYDLHVYRHAGFKDWLGSFNYGSSKLSSNANNQISSAIVKRGVWDFYDLPYYVGRILTLTPGWWSYVGNRANDDISSIKRRPGT